MKTKNVIWIVVIVIIGLVFFQSKKQTPKMPPILKDPVKKNILD